MALSNIFREPRREITEQLVGFGITLPPWGWSTYWLGSTVYECPSFNESPCWAGAFFTPPVAVILTLVVMTIAHFIGEEICDAFEDRDIHLRPRERH